MAADTPEKSETAPPGEADVSMAAKRRSLWGYFIKCLKNYATFRGRARRREFWAFALFYTLFCGVFSTAFFFASASVFVSVIETDIPPIFFLTVLLCLGVGIFTLCFALPGIAVTVRRLHDAGMSGWRILIPPVGIIAPPVLMFALFYYGFGFDGEASFFPALAAMITFWLTALLLTVELLIWLCRKSDPEANRYGSNPKAGDCPRPAIEPENGRLPEHLS